MKRNGHDAITDGYGPLPLQSRIDPLNSGEM